MNMLVAGKLSGIQDFIFDVKMEGGAQAKRLRARSFFVQVLTEVLYLRTADFLEVEPKQAQVFCGAGKFLLSGETRNVSRLNLLEREVNEKLLRDAAGRLSFSCAWFESEGTFKDSYERVMKRLSFRKKQPFISVFSKGGDWDKKSLRLRIITPPCDLCEQEKAEKIEEGYSICKTCWMMRKIGSELVQENKKYLVISPDEKLEFPVGGWSFRFDEEGKADKGRYVLLIDGERKVAGEEFTFQRQLLRHIPKSGNEIISFVELAERAKGDRLLGLLKIDVDSLGRSISNLIAEGDGLNSLSDFSRRLDDFFSVTLTSKMKRKEWNYLYTIFSGGDDLMIVGPWNELLDFAGEIYQEFKENFKKENLTLSGAMITFKPKIPIRAVASEGENWLAKAKETILEGENENRNQFAAFGQIWKWHDHEEILKTAKKLVMWVEEKRFKRGWLHDLLRIANMRQKSGGYSKLATAHLVYLWSRNVDRSDGEIWDFGRSLINHFDEMDSVVVKYLPAIVRYALTSTRSREE